MLDVHQLESFNQLARIIRSGASSNCPTLIYSFIEFGVLHSKNINDVVNQREIFYYVYPTLLETICDPLIDQYWRRVCLDNIHKPLHQISELAQTNDEKKENLRLKNEFITVCSYFL